MRWETIDQYLGFVRTPIFSFYAKPGSAGEARNFAADRESPGAGIGAFASLDASPKVGH